MKSYGTNSQAAYKDECLERAGRDPVEKHTWKFLKSLGRCFTEYRCFACGATCSIDSGD